MCPAIRRMQIIDFARGGGADDPQDDELCRRGGGAEAQQTPAGRVTSLSVAFSLWHSLGEISVGLRREIRPAASIISGSRLH